MTILISLLILSLNIICYTHAKQNITSYIVGGTNAKIEDFPYMAFLQINIDNVGNSLCGGTYIRDVWVLTASHCLVIGSPREVGRHDRVLVVMELESLNQQSYQKSRSVQLIIHPNYFNNEFRVQNDIALIKIQSRFKITRFCKMASLPKTMIKTGSTVIAIGWGATKATDVPGDITRPKKLQRITVRVLNGDQCRKIAYSENVICVGEKGKVPCFGDSGGPLIYENRVVGASSFGFGCNGSFAVYEDVYSHLDWIGRTTDSYVEKSNTPNLRGKVFVYLVCVVLLLN